MTPVAVDTPELAREANAADRVIDACRQAALVSHEARRLKSLAADAVDDGVHAAKRAIKSVRRRVEELGDLKDGAMHRLKREPLKALSAAVGIGLVLGVAIGWIGRGPRSRQ